MDGYTQPLVMEAMMRYSPSTLLAQSRRHFVLFRQRQDLFSPGADCWQDAGDPWLFWQTASQHSPGLAALASRLFKTPANSVPSERAFSTQNLVHTKTRNRLDAQHVDKLTYVRINARALEHRQTTSSGMSPRTFYDIPATEILDLEEEALEELQATGGVQCEIEDNTQEIWEAEEVPSSVNCEAQESQLTLVELEETIPPAGTDAAY